MWLAMASLILWLVSYTALCWTKPFAPCRKCAGMGELQRFGKTKTCPRCHGHRLRLRIGRRLHNAWRSVHADGTR